MKKDMVKTNKTILVLFLLLASISFISAQSQESFSTWCAERTIDGAYCQNVPEDQIDPNFRSSPTSCDSTSFCQLGCCYDSSEGLCGENVPESACIANNGLWSDSPNCQIPQCDQGCCVLGTEASFTSLQRCKKLAGDFGIQTDFRPEITNELACIQLATNQDVGACVYESQFTRTCEFTTRGNCNVEYLSERGLSNSETVEFYQDFLCTAEDLNTNCQRTEQTSCFDGADEVYFVDTCGNKANIYDSSKVEDTNYWRKVVSKEESCKGNPSSCGNCDYLGGSICAPADRGTRVIHGNNYCQNTNCIDSEGTPRKNGESWCVYDEGGNAEDDRVGSRHVREVCFMGEVTVEACADYRQETCIEDSIGDGFSQAGCVVNRWQDCVLQGNQEDCENPDKRDCSWIVADLRNTRFTENTELGVCVPTISPGIQFWDESATSQCEIADQSCIVKYEKKLLGGKECVENCHCLDPGWKSQATNICTAIGDCGSDHNYIGVFSEQEKNIAFGKPAQPGEAQPAEGDVQTSPLGKGIIDTLLGGKNDE